VPSRIDNSTSTTGMALDGVDPGRMLARFASVGFDLMDTAHEVAHAAPAARLCRNRSTTASTLWPSWIGAGRSGVSRGRT
jgi:hypothetical protein